MRGDDAAADGEAEAGAALVARIGRVDLLEALEDAVELVGRNAAPLILDDEGEHVAARATAAEPHCLPAGGELHGVAEQIRQRLDDAVVIAPELFVRDVVNDLHPGAVGE